MESHSQIEDAVTEWLARRDSGRWSEDDEACLQQWIAVSTARRVAYLRLKSTWDMASRLRVLRGGTSPTQSAGAVPAPGEWRRSPFFEQSAVAAPATVTAPRRRRGMLVAAVAASVVIGISAGFAAYQLWSTSGDRYVTPVGGLASVPMPDGSNVTLNTDSQIRVAVTDTERRVELQQGEAFFDVAKDPTRPFVVHAGARRIVAVGTRFSVQRLDDDVRVLVTEGRVRIEGEASSPVLIAAGSVARAAGSAVVVRKALPPQVDELLSWREGYLRFHETSLADAVAQMNRYNTRKIVIEDPGLAAIRISGTFRPTQYEAFVRVLQDGFSIQARNESERIALTGGP
ncbi:MAG TPA: FecR domain-containing protein [Steroidobacteraceae bacterium]|nr:FecR domain-containing protein [Steroidobacteraceae bacterium]